MRSAPVAVAGGLTFEQVSNAAVGHSVWATTGGQLGDASQDRPLYADAGGVRDVRTELIRRARYARGGREAGSSSAAHAAALARASQLEVAEVRVGGEMRYDWGSVLAGVLDRRVGTAATYMAAAGQRPDRSRGGRCMSATSTTTSSWPRSKGFCNTGTVWPWRPTVVIPDGA
jgi:hypothetical protein